MTDATEFDEAAIRKAAERSLNTGDWWDPHDLREALDRIADVGDDTRADAEYIWQVRPAKVLAALDEITRLRAALDEARAEVEQVSAARAKPLLAALMQVTAERDEARAERDSVQFALDGFRAVARRDNEHLIARAEAAKSALAAVRALVDRDHRPIECSNIRCPVGQHCVACEEFLDGAHHWPCDYALALATATERSQG